MHCLLYNPIDGIQRQISFSLSRKDFEPHDYTKCILMDDHWSVFQDDEELVFLSLNSQKVWMKDKNNCVTFYLVLFDQSWIYCL